MEELETSKLFYRQMAKRYERRFPLFHLTDPDSRTIIPELDLKNGLSILEVGCGNGKFLFTLANILSHFTAKGIDTSVGAIKSNNRKNKFSQLEFVHGSGESIPFPENHFDIVCCSNNMKFFPQKVRAIDEMYRVLKPGGHCYILEGIASNDWKQKYDKILRQTKFIQPRKKYLSRSSVFCKSYLVIASK
jgi:ubiquinone/menaquinone biosynthesis C-methylase UbiE